ncbi:MAG: hypothetical protein Q9186_000605 [Xanthomendoza sp. 1 TL-2023]
MRTKLLIYFDNIFNPLEEFSDEQPADDAAFHTLQQGGTASTTTEETGKPGALVRSNTDVGPRRQSLSEKPEVGMGTAIYTDPVPNTTRFHPVGVMGDTLPNSRRSESTCISTQARIPSSSSTPTQSTISTHRSRSGSQNVQSPTPVAGPPSHPSTQHTPYDPCSGHPLQRAVKDACEKIQHFGAYKDETGAADAIIKVQGWWSLQSSLSVALADLSFRLADSVPN